MTQEYSVALTGQVGTYLDNVLHGLLGVKRARYDMGVKADGGQNVDGTAGKTLWGPVVGFGYKRVVAKDWVFNSELSYEIYRSAKTGDLDTGAKSIGTRIKPNVLNLTFGLAYKF